MYATVVAVQCLFTFRGHAASWASVWAVFSTRRGNCDASIELTTVDIIIYSCGHTVSLSVH